MENTYLETEPHDGVRFMRGMLFGILFAVPIWMIVISSVMTISMVIK